MASPTASAYPRAMDQDKEAKVVALRTSLATQRQQVDDWQHQRNGLSSRDVHRLRGEIAEGEQFLRDLGASDA